MYAEQGVRVVRGNDWKDGDQDVSDGLLGTVVKVRNEIVNVVWDNGTCGSYKVGDNASELLAHDATKNGESLLVFLISHVCYNGTNLSVSSLWSSGLYFL